jgi:hypothetical protein
MVVTAIDSIPVLSGPKSGKFNQMIGKVIPIRNSPLLPLTSCHLSHITILLNSPKSEFSLKFDISHLLHNNQTAVDSFAVVF